MSKKKYILLIGPPAIGKTTWVQQNMPNAFVVNRDQIVEEVAEKHGLTYDDAYVKLPNNISGYSVINTIIPEYEKYGPVVEVFDSVKNFIGRFNFEKVLKINLEVSRLLHQRFLDAISSNKDVVVDMTNMSSWARKHNLNYLTRYGKKEEYEVIAVVFKYSGDIIEKIHKSSCKRNEELKKIGKSKNIPLQAIKDMHRKFEYPEYSEGFNKIIDYESYINKTKI